MKNNILFIIILMFIQISGFSQNTFIFLGSGFNDSIKIIDLIENRLLFEGKVTSNETIGFAKEISYIDKNKKLQFSITIANKEKIIVTYYKIFKKKKTMIKLDYLAKNYYNIVFLNKKPKFI